MTESSGLLLSLVIRDFVITLFENKIQSLVFVTCVVFLALTSGYNCCTHFRTGEVSQIENRKLADPPAASMFLDNVSGYMGSFEQFYNDRFADRLTLQRIRSLIMYKFLFTSSSPSVVLGGKDWLFYLTEDLATNDALNAEQIKNWLQLFRTRRDFLASHGIKYVVMLVPEKGTIEPEYLPAIYRSHDRASRYKQMREILNTNAVVENVDLLTVFEKVSDRRTLYYKTDSHWTFIGARLAALALAAKLHTLFPSLSTDHVEQVKLFDGTVSGDLAKMLNLQGVLSEKTPDVDQKTLKAIISLKTSGEDGKPPEIDTSSTGGDVNKGLVLQDSFALMLQPFLSELFQKARFFKTHSMPIEEILRYKPDVVIEEMAERNLYALGYADDLGFGIYPYQPINQRVEKASEPLSASSIQAEFSNGFCIQEISRHRDRAKLAVSIDWRVKKDQVANRIVEIQLLDKSGKTVASVKYPQNPSYFVFSEGIKWRDEIDLEVPAEIEFAKVGISLVKEPSPPSHVIAKLCDSNNTRALF